MAQRCTVAVRIGTRRDVSGRDSSHNAIGGPAEPSSASMGLALCVDVDGHRDHMGHRVGLGRRGSDGRRACRLAGVPAGASVHWTAGANRSGFTKPRYFAAAD